MLQCLLAFWTHTGKDVKGKNQEGFQKKQKMGTSFRDGETLIAGLHTLRAMLVFPTKKKCCWLQIPLFVACQLWKPRDRRVLCPVQKQTSASHGHTPSIQPNNFILQMHNTSCIWTAVTKQTWTQGPFPDKSFFSRAFRAMQGEGGDV